LFVIVEVPLLPCVKESEAGEAEILKLSTISENVVEAVTPPPVPVIVMVYDPPGAVAGAKRVTWQVLPEGGGPVQQGGTLTVTPAGMLPAWSATPALNPPEVVIVIG